MTRLFQPLMTLAAGSLLLACASAPPAQLVAARDAYSFAEGGTAATMAPAELKTAEEALARAERAFRDEGAEPRTNDLAYVAERRAQIATAIADRRLAEKSKTTYEDRRATLSDELREQTAAELSSTKARLGNEEERTAAERTGRVRAEQDAKASANEARVANAEADAANAKVTEMRAALAKWAMLVENERGLVITLSSGVLFKTGRAEVLPAAATRLSQVAGLLVATPGRRVIVEGHTDSAGGDDFNQTLSQQRAESVRAFLIAQGVKESGASAVGYGESRPIAANTSQAGRATNRRVEIILEPIPVPLPAAASSVK